ncbi:XRE family transcriptional regulator [Enterococcus pseudoavium]|uniref:XRE family transcriptional regulator n=1 Tax=Enterococcus pseudoavium TaxID=44007 RepID=A0ABU3FKK6_9ENTE|nr:XRE family transcriptional regulator [Enterococcus pseudoavium]MDT2771598.1 XRE family transcriptional regulator [Enterococcus pseudoavium]
MEKEELAQYIGNKIKEMRISQGKTQEDLALLLNTTKQSIGRYENGSRRANQDLLFELADIFDCSINDFFPPIETTASIESIYNQLDQPRKTKVYNFAEYQLREQNKKPKLFITIRGYVSAGTGEWLEDEIVDEVSYEGVIPEHDFAVKVNGDSMLPLFEDGQVIFIKGTSDVRDGQIIVCQVNNEAFVKKLSGNKLVSLNKKYEDISISDTDDFKIYGVVVL